MKITSKTIVLTLIATLMSTLSWAQGVTLRGKVIDASDNSPLIGATVIASGSSRGAITGEGGSFTLSGLKKGVATKIEISYLGYSDATIEVTLTKGDTQYPTAIALKPESINAGEVVVTGRAPIARQMGDTIQFNADAFKVQPDATAADLVAKMPGMTVGNDGTPTHGGETVTRITVDGKTFFRDDPATALASLPADAIESIQVLEEKSDDAKFSGIDDGERTKKINIVTKAKRKKNFFGDYLIGYGTDNHYNVKTKTNIFYDKHRLTIGFGLNDINQSATSGGRFYGGFGQSGLQSAAGVILNYSGEFKDKNGHKTEAGVDYIFNHKNNNNITSLERIYSPTSAYNERIYTEDYAGRTKTFFHMLRSNIESELGDKDRIIFRPYFRYNTTDSHRITEMLNIQDGLTTNSALTDNGSDNTDWRVGGNLNWMHILAPRHTLSMSANFNVGRDNTTQIIDGFNSFYRKEELIDSLINQYSGASDVDNSVGGRISYTYKLTDHSSVMAAYNVSYNWDDYDKKTYIYDPLTGLYEDLEASLSNVFTRNYLNNTAGFGYNYNVKDKITINITANYRNSSLKSRYTYPDDNNYDYSFNSIVANAGLDYYFSKSKRLRLFYRGRPGLPSMSQLQEVVDNSNPLLVTMGNPALKQSYTNNIHLSYHNTNTDKSSTMFVLARFSSTTNSFANDTRILTADEVIGGVSLQKGAQLSTPVNINGQWSFNTFFNYSTALPRLKSNIDVGVEYGLSRTPSIYDGIRSHSRNNSGGLFAALTSNISSALDFTLSSRTGVTYSTGNRNTGSRTYLNESVGVRLNWIIAKGFFLNTDYSFNLNHYSSGGENNNYNLLNAGIGKKFLKKQNAEVRLSAFDLLNQGRSISYSVNDTYTQNSVSNILKRYFMVSFSYKFNTMSSGSQGSPGGDRRPAGPPHGGRPPMMR